MINNFIGIVGRDKQKTTEVVEKIIKNTNSKTDQGNIQMNILINNKDLLENCSFLKEIGSKEILIIEDENYEYIQNQLGINILTINDIEYIVTKYKNEVNE